jgi:hypothetical protein
MLLEALSSELGSAPAPSSERPRFADITPLHRAGLRARPSRRQWTWVGGLVAAVVLLAAGVALERRPADPAIADLLSGDQRPFAERLAYPAADHHRDLRLMRGPEATRPLPLGVVARLDEAGDYEGVAAACLLAGMNDQAELYLNRAQPTDAVAVDRAVLAMRRQRWPEARSLLEAVLARQPRHPQGLWDLALVQEQLGDRQGAARTLDQVAALREPGWAAEAARRADELRR